MLNIIWFSLIALSIIFGIMNNQLDAVVQAVPEYAKLSIDLVIGLVGLMVFWLGVMRIAEESGLLEKLAALLKPILRWLFPEVPADHPAMGAMLMNMSANMLGLTNAATPLGLKAMQSLQAINPEKDVASHAMCMFLAINTSSIQIIPMSAIAYLAAAGNKQPTEIITTAILATICSTIAAIGFVKTYQLYLNKRARC